jgi:serine phosphatase RsbU (regulator of sigma subunit)
VRTIPSDAFGRATMRSERQRIVGLMTVLGALAVVAAGRALLRPEPGERVRLPLILGFLACGAAYEGVVLWALCRAERAGRAVRAWVWGLNTIVECTVPTLALLGLTIDRGYLGPYRALAAPTVLLYCLFIILATLRLRPGLCVLSGVVSAAGYTAVYAYTRMKFPNHPAADTLPAPVFAVYPALLLAAGLVAAGVAGQIRRHVIAALNEAEARRRLDQVESDLRLARSIQRGLLPQEPPCVSGYDVAGWNKPADQTGGDYYDWMGLPDGRVLFTIADATGHGIGPALLSTSCRAYFRAVAAGDAAPERVTTRVDALLAADAQDGRFVTAAVALLMPKEHRLMLYSAGHGPLFRYDAATDVVEATGADQPPLGIGYGEDGAARAREIALAPGDALVLVTDGFFECSNPAGERLGADRLADAIRRHRALTAGELIQRLYAEVVAFSGDGATQADDLTAVVIKRVGEAY